MVIVPKYPLNAASEGVEFPKTRFRPGGFVDVHPHPLAASHIPDTTSVTTVTYPFHACCVRFLSRGRSAHLQAGPRSG